MKTAPTRGDETVALLTVRLYGDPVLRQVAAPVRDITADIKRIIANMTETI